MATLSLHNVIKRFGETEIIHGVDLAINDGEFIVFVGPSGCGKSTLLRLIAGLDDTTEGEIKIAGQAVNDLAPSKRGAAMVFQSYALYPHMNVYDNIAFGLKVRKHPKEFIEERVNEVAEILQLTPLLNRKPKELSGGQRQRVAIGRAITRQPEVFLFDEPLSNLDAELRVAMRMEIARLHEKMNATMIYVTHDQVEAMTMADRIVVLRAGQIEQVGTPAELYTAPENVFVAGFIGSPKMNFISVTSKEFDGTKQTFTLESGQSIKLPVDSPTDGEKQFKLGVRPEHLFINRTGDLNITIKATASEYLGENTLVYGDLNGQSITLKVDGHQTILPGQEIAASAAVRDIYLFDDQDRSVLQNYRRTLLKDALSVKENKEPATAA
ncbi:sn-glycerol-3-phosphate ABC transporter ATP-binding protein UgpC [Sansalvadorimonas sp. 2012CJ34-2]|uniref:Sn-glycerol-3-phosphate ABC transporter ATP-binding protein UgpC n=1 Tax=Parendozoicomonas callyspongiae TaxID=2942213 RepID=A0ABT0PE30_9GAMM|nr:sn-glycerol-3-phosphate ABC transporter ATP-binding protein UgpC [Sansalvadorimonas sp. 2012CJ34-2]MCL6269644.1 sn-glycerol-3-phosphate ABC transporter ATP-binding protein UgpC [Sansalvadorimonas sp. 2012CJ34-2]